MFAKNNMIITIYENNFLICDVKKKVINKVKDALKTKFHMSDPGPVSLYLEMTFTRDCTNEILCLSQQAHLDKIFKNHGIWECKVVVMPIDRSLTLSLKNYQATDVVRT